MAGEEEAEVEGGSCSLSGKAVCEPTSPSGKVAS